METREQQPGDAPGRRRRKGPGRDAERSPERRRVGLRIREALLSVDIKPMSQEASERLGVSKTTLSRWVHGHQLPRVEQLQRLSQVTGRAVAWFHGAEGTVLVKDALQEGLVALLAAADEGEDLGEAMEAIMAPYGRLDPQVRQLASRLGRALTRELAGPAGTGYRELSPAERGQVVQEEIRRHTARDQVREIAAEGPAAGANSHPPGRRGRK